MCFDTSKLAMMIGFHIIGYLFVKLPFEMLNVHRLQHWFLTGEYPWKSFFVAENVSPLGKLQPPTLRFMLNTIWRGFWPNHVLAQTKHVQNKGRNISQQACEFKIQIFRHRLLLLKKGHNFAWMAWQLSWCEWHGQSSDRSILLESKLGQKLFSQDLD